MLCDSTDCSVIRIQHRDMIRRPLPIFVRLLGWLLITTTGPTLVVDAADLTNCRKALGMQSGTIPDHAITASSSYDSASVGPSNARIRTERNGGAWCPKPQIARNVYEWIEVDLHELKVITQVETQGRFGNGQGQEYAEAYMLEYQRTETGRWIRFRDRKGSEVLLGNSNTYIAEPRDINPPIIARRIRIIPHSNHPRTVCMRLELYGCQWRDGVLSYSMPQGDRRGTEVDLFDFTYDGEVRDETYLVGGLGQLTDGVEGHSNFRQDLDGWGRKGYEWVGWKNDSTDRTPMPTAIPGNSQQQQLPIIEIIFEFERVRNFTTVRFHVNNMFSKEVRVFRRAVLYFSVGGTLYQQQPIVYDYMRDTLIDFARNVIINIPNRIGRFIKIELYFDARWIMLSEVRFESELASGNYSEESLLPSHTSSSSLAGATVDQRRSSTSSNSSTIGSGETDFSGDSTRNPVSSSLNDQVVGIVAGTLAAAGLLLAGIVVFCVVCRRRRFTIGKKSSAGKVPVARPPNYAAAISGRLGNDVIVTSSGRKTSNGGNAYSSATSYSTAVTSLLHQQQQLAGIDDCYDDEDVVKVAPLGGLPLGGLCENGTSAYDRHNQLNEIASQQPRRPLPDVPRIPVDLAGYLSDTNTSTYAVPEHLLSTPTSAFSFSRPAPFACQPPTVGMTLPHQSSIYRSQQDVNAGASTMAGSRSHPLHPSGSVTAAGGFHQHGGSGREMFSGLLHSNVDDSGVYSALPGTPAFGAQGEDVELNEILRDSISFIEKIGEGQFGEVHLCEMALRPQTDTELNSGRHASLKPTIVAVKVLNKDASNKARDEYFSEAKMMACLKDPNIVSLLGVCRHDDPVCIVLEYMKHGDLNQFLQVHVAAESSLVRSGTGLVQMKALSYGCLIYMATQIASGMKYLETLNVVHRDLATRNCLVGHKYAIKISDFGMSRSLYSVDYYPVEGKALLPIRWMAWESLLLGKFSTKSDVWSFAATLWEILTFARERPFESLTDEQVIQNCTYYSQGDTDYQMVLPQPANCPREIYDLMVECWNPDTTQRPAFREVHMFLQRKNMGYNPADERRTPSRTATPHA